MPRTWTEEQKRKQAEIIRRHKPWEKSTGPKSDEGKQRSKYNNLRHGFCGAGVRAFRQALAAQRAFVRGLTVAFEIPEEGRAYHKRLLKVRAALRELDAHGITLKTNYFPKDEWLGVDELYKHGWRPNCFPENGDDKVDELLSSPPGEPDLNGDGRGRA